MKITIFTMYLNFENIKHVLVTYNGMFSSYGTILDETTSNQYFKLLFDSLPWESDVLKMFGKKIVTKRKTVWFSDDALSYTYAGQTKKGLPWTTEVLLLKKLVEEQTKVTYNACLLNIYHSGAEGMSWHADDEKEIEENSSIACLSLGATRRFDIKHKTTNEIHKYSLKNGSLIEMSREFQVYWKHQIPIQNTIKKPRISLTFRVMKT